MKKIDTSSCYVALSHAILSDIKHRIPKSADDFGDDETVGLCVKRKDHSIFSGDPNDSFGIFLGKDNNNNYIIGINELGYKFKFVSGESFESLESLKQNWILD